MSDASYYQAHKDDSDEWEEPALAPTPPTRRLSSMISVRLDPGEEALLRRRAQASGQTLSEFIRQTLLDTSRHGASAARTSTSSLGKVQFRGEFGSDAHRVFWWTVPPGHVDDEQERTLGVTTAK